MDLLNNGWISIGFLKSINGFFFQNIALPFSFSYGNSLFCPNYQRPAKIHNHITASKGKVAIAYVDQNCKVKVARWSSDGFYLGDSYIAFTGGGSEQVIPMLASSGDTIFAQWQGRLFPNDSCGPFRLGGWATYWAVSTDWGQTFSFPQKVSSVVYLFSENPLGHDYNGWIFDNGRLYTTWGNDYRDGNTGDVYFSYTPRLLNISEMFVIEDKAKKPYEIKYKGNNVIIEAKSPFSIYKANGENV
ncbi:MAG: hypothetical protein ABIL49_07070 [candidate division WOR-3 bacterium]